LRLIGVEIHPLVTAESGGSPNLTKRCL